MGVDMVTGLVESTRQDRLLSLSLSRQPCGGQKEEMEGLSPRGQRGVGWLTPGDGTDRITMFSLELRARIDAALLFRCTS